MRDFGWRIVRSLGGLQILNRVSIFSLIVVPLLAALTAFLQGQFGSEWPEIGASAALLFFASLSVTLGLMVYQVWSAEEIRKFDEDEFIDRAHKRYPEDAADRHDGLRRAIEHLEVAAKLRPDRHPNFVKHHGDTIWIPPRDKADVWFEDWAPSEAEPQVKSDDDDQEAKGEVEQEPRESKKSEPIAQVPGAERRRITIEEGAKAEYWLKSRESVFFAWVSFILYLLGIGCLLWILIIQAVRVADVANWKVWPFN